MIRRTLILISAVYALPTAQAQLGTGGMAPVGYQFNVQAAAVLDNSWPQAYWQPSPGRNRYGYVPIIMRPELREPAMPIPSRLKDGQPTIAGATVPGRKTPILIIDTADPSRGVYPAGQGTSALNSTTDAASLIFFHDHRVRLGTPATVRELLVPEESPSASIRQQSSN